MTTRRTFIKQSSWLLSGLALAPSKFKSNMPVGIQLYSLRNQIGTDVGTILQKIAAAGYGDVETFGYADGKFFGQTPAQFKQLLQKNHLTSTSGHYQLNKFLLEDGPDDDVKNLIDVVKATGQHYLTVSSFSHDHVKNADDYKKVAGRFNKAGEICKKGGVQLAYHNHNTEFDPLNGGVSGYDVLLKETSPSLLKMELDLYWAVRGKQEPVDMFRKYPGRFEMWHVKDMDKTKMEKNTEVGSGSIDYKKIFAAAKQSGMKHFYMEQENFDMDPYESIAKSCKYIKQQLL